MWDRRRQAAEDLIGESSELLLPVLFVESVDGLFPCWAEGDGWRQGRVLSHAFFDDGPSGFLAHGQGLVRIESVLVRLGTVAVWVHEERLRRESEFYTEALREAQDVEEEALPFAQFGGPIGTFLEAIEEDVQG